MYWWSENLLFSEIVIVVAEGLLIKYITEKDFMQDNDFTGKGIRWYTALGISAFANIASYLLGTVPGLLRWA